MLAEALVALASTGGNALVTAMVTDGWEGMRTRIARLFGRGEKKETEATLERLDQSRAMLAGLAGAKLARVRAEQEIVWRTRVGDLLERDPAVADELGVLVAQIHAQSIGSAGRVEQHVTGIDHAQQAVQGYGVQNVTFGGQGGHSAGS
jgi:hypothetical protein